MAITRQELVARLQGEVAAIADASARAIVEASLVEPTLINCSWDYGFPGETFPCWKVARDSKRAVGIVFCESGFGPRCPWGLVWFHDAVPAMGQDSGWFSTFHEAAADMLEFR